MGVTLATVKFVPIDIRVEGEENQTLLSVAQQARVTDVTCCGMNPLCGKCKVSIVTGEDGLSAQQRREQEYCRENGFLPYQRLGCLARLSQDVELLVELERYTEGDKEEWQKANLEL
jgi:ferredoxin